MTGNAQSHETVAVVLGALVVQASGKQKPRRAKVAVSAPLRRPRERIIRVREVLHRVGVHRGTVYKWIKDGRFPAQVQLGANSAGWYESEIDAWIADPTGWRPPDTS